MGVPEVLLLRLEELQVSELGLTSAAARNLSGDFQKPRTNP